jgi:hypothetical protein
MIRNDTYFAIKMKNKYDLTETELKYILGEKYSHKLKDILKSSKTDNIKTIEEETIASDKKEENKDKPEEKIQQSLFDF